LLGMPNFRIQKPTGENKNIRENVLEYQSTVGTLLFLLKHSQPCLVNPLRELSKVLDCPTEVAWKEQHRLIKFVLDTKEYGLKVEPTIEEFNKLWTITVFLDSDYTGDSDTRISVTGFCIFLLGVPIVWKRKRKKSTTLSSSKAEFVALSEAVKEIKFVVQVLESIGAKVKFPIIV